MRRIRGGDFFHHQYKAERIEPRAAVFLGHLDAHESELARLGDGGGGEFTARVVPCGDGHDLVLRELARCRLDHQLLIGKSEVHG